MNDQTEPGWEAVTWEGSRREQLRRGLRLAPRERLAAMVALVEAAERLAASPEAITAHAPVDGRNGDPAGPEKE